MIQKDKERNKAYNAAYYKAHSEEIRLRKAAYCKVNPGKETAYKMKWAKANPEKVKASIAKWTKANLEKINAYKAIWIKTNPEKVKASKAKYINAHREEHNTRNMAWAKAHPEKDKASHAKWAKANPEKIIAKSARRRAMKYNAPGNGITPEQVKTILINANGICAYCKQPLDKLTLDHVIPLSKNGAHDISNAVASCLSCNCSKGSKLLDEWKCNSVNSK
jgi:5-methylcytosine-specific restriction endonuclease McrA